MRHLLLTLGLITSLTLAACGGDSGGVAGTYEIDKTALEKMAIEGAKEKAKVDELPEAALAMIKQGLKDMKATLVIKSDGTWAGSAAMPGKPKEEGSGTWTMDGDKLTMVTTMKDGKPATEEEEDDVATYKDGALLMTDSKDPSIVIRMVRK